VAGDLPNAYVVFILQPGLAMFRYAALAGLGAGGLVAVSQVAIRRMTDTEPPIRIVLYFSLLSTVISAFPLAWDWQTPTPWQLGMLWLIGALAVAGQMLQLKK